MDENKNIEEETTPVEVEQTEEANEQTSNQSQTTTEQMELTPIAKHRMEKQKLIDEKDTKAKEDRKKVEEEAEAYKKSVIEEREHKLSINQQKNREEEEKLYETNETKSDNPWEDVTKYIDFKFAETQRSNDTTRFKKLLIRLKNEKL
mmetsp:Transcript_81/g.140  ORF Transcript_81/g.140 Transcript_81/m.140 type:complete len:148 (-) Transcript_81:12-455(-)